MTQQTIDTLRRLADWTAPEGTGVVSVYCDMRPQASGERPGAREADVILKDRLNRIEKSLLPRGPGLDSFRKDRPRIEAAFDDNRAGTAGLAIFACHAGGLFEVVRSGTEFANRISFGRRPALFKLARLVDEFEPAVVAVADTNTLRLFVVRFGALREVRGKDEDSIHFQKRSTGGYSEARYQRHIDKHRREFAEEAAAAISDLVQRERATRLVLAGDEVAIPLLRDALPRDLTERLTGDALRIHIRANRDDVAAEVAEVLAVAEDRSSRKIADELVGEVLEDDLGVAGIEETRDALLAGQADVLVLAAGFQPTDVREEFTRQAIRTGARIEVVDGHAGLDALGGVGALLRYRT
jgi:peptide chain release factor subunit 1